MNDIHYIPTVNVALCLASHHTNKFYVHDSMYVKYFLYTLQIIVISKPLAQRE